MDYPALRSLTKAYPDVKGVGSKDVFVQALTGKPKPE
jgi:hypothetical protein